MIGYGLGNLLIIAGTLLIAIAVIGLYRLPDFFTRIHVLGKPDTLGGMLILGGLALHSNDPWVALKLLLVLVFFGIANPVAAHVLTRAALKSGLGPRRKGEST